MNISRGFRRLSVLTGLVGGIAMLVIGLGPNGTLGREPLSLTILPMIVGLIMFVAVPVGFVLLLGWVVAGFQKSS